MFDKTGSVGWLSRKLKKPSEKRDCEWEKKISKDVLKSVFLNFEKRCNLIISAQGGHIE